MKNLVVVGQGYVGLPMALEAAKNGLNVVGLDTNDKIVKSLNDGQSHIDDVSNMELVSGRNNGYRATTDPSCIRNADVVVVCVPTPLGSEGGPDLIPVINSAKTIGANIEGETLCILESTTYPGTTEEIFAPEILKNLSSEKIKKTHIAFSPERIDPGNAKFGVKNTPKVVGGLTNEATELAVKFYSIFVNEVIAAKGAKEAEMAKLLENTFRHVNIALVNEMLRFSQELDIDLWNAIDCAESKPFGFMAFRPGPGVGGHCIPVDPNYLSHRVKAKLGYAFRMVELAEEINIAAPQYVATRAWRNLNDRRIAVNGAKILLLGVTYKENIADRRESPADPIYKRLASWGAEVSYHDPFVPTWTPKGSNATLENTENLKESVQSADLVILLQPHGSYDLHELVLWTNALLDTRGKLTESPSVERL